MVLAAKPPDIKRPRVILMVGLRNGRAALLAWATLHLSSADAHSYGTSSTELLPLFFGKCWLMGFPPFAHIGRVAGSTEFLPWHWFIGATRAYTFHGTLHISSVFT